MENVKPLKWLINHSGKEKFNMIILIVLNALLSAVSVLYAFTIRIIVEGATTPSEEGLKRLILGAVLSVGVIVLQFTLRALIGLLSERIKAKLEIGYKTYIFNGLLKKNYSKISSYHSGEIINRLTSDVSVICEGLTSIFPSVVSALIRMLFAIGALLTIVLDFVYAVAFISVGILIFVIVTVLKKKLKLLHSQSQQSEGKTRSFMQESVENLLTVKALSINDKVEKQSDEYQNNNFKIKMKRRRYAVIGSSFQHMLFSFGYIFAMIYGGYQIYTGVIGYGDLTAILQLVNNIQIPFMSLTNVFPQYYSMIASTERLIELDNIEEEQLPDTVDREQVNGKLISVSGKGIKFSYGDKPVIEEGNFEINKGDFAVVIGQSGIGKSTLIKLLLGVYPINQGKLCLELNDGEKNIDSSTRNMFSFVPQGNMIFSGSLKDNLCFVKPNATKEEIDFALEVSCAKEFVDELPEGINTKIGENGLGLSEGQVQRLAIARAVLLDAPIMLLDEATSALDEKTEKKVLASLKELNGKTVIMVSHKNASLEICNKVIKVEDGKIMQL